MQHILFLQRTVWIFSSEKEKLPRRQMPTFFLVFFQVSFIEICGTGNKTTFIYDSYNAIVCMQYVYTYYIKKNRFSLKSSRNCIICIHPFEYIVFIIKKFRYHSQKCRVTCDLRFFFIWINQFRKIWHESTFEISFDMLNLANFITKSSFVGK